MRAYIFTRFLKFYLSQKGFVLVSLVILLVFWKFCWSIRSINENNWPQSFYIFSAYRITDNIVRILYLKDVNLRRNLYYRFRNFDILIETPIKCQRSQCPLFYDEYCSLNGHLSNIEIPIVYQHSYLDSIELSTSNNLPLKTISAHVIDARPIFQLKHYLGICLQPIFYLISPKLMVSFFEYWILQDATIFYIYRHSWSSEIQKVFEFYYNHPKISVKLIDWPNLPIDETKTLNPNKFSRRLEFSLAMADCVYRSRRETNFLAMTDLDEQIHIDSKKTVKEFIQLKASRDTVALWFSSAKIVDISNSTLIWRFLKKPIQSKLIVNSQLTKTINVHTPGKPEDYSMNKVFEISPLEAVIVHSRFDYIQNSPNFQPNILSMIGLSKLQISLEFHVERVFNFLKISQTKYETEQKQIFKDFDKCAEVYKHKTFCKSVEGCRDFISNLDFIESKIIKASPKWIIV